MAANAPERFIEKHEDDESIRNFVKEQLRTTTKHTQRSIESHTVEAARLGCSRKEISNRRNLISTGLVSLQRACANAFLEHLCNKCEEVSGVCQTYYEKHRGDETPYSRCGAHDDVFADTPMTIADKPSDDVAIPVAVADPSQLLATNVQSEKTTGITVDSYTSNLKVYQTDLEIGALFVMPDHELLVTFKLITTLARVDRCTGRNYATLHQRQSNVLPSRHRFRRIQRVHTSDGDKAQTLAERLLALRLQAAGTRYVVSTFRPQCQVHRVLMNLGMLVVSSYIPSAIRMALNLRGPGYFNQFKKILWDYLSLFICGRSGE